MSPVLDAQGRVRAAGGIPWRRSDDGIEVLLAHRPRYDDWTFPKGKADVGESDARCALREVAEEVGLGGTLGPELMGTVYVDRSGRIKRVRYWAIEADGQPFRVNEEVDEVRWLPPRDARRMLSYRRDRPVLDDLAALADRHRGSPPVVLVRHADAGAPGSSAGPDIERPLTGRGHDEAAAIAARLRLVPVEAVLSSPARRCLETAGSIAREAGLEVTACESLIEGSAASAIDAVRQAGRPSVMVSHGDIIPAVLQVMRPSVVNHNGEMLDGHAGFPCAKASAWVLQRSDAGWTARYLAPFP